MQDQTVEWTKVLVYIIQRTRGKVKFRSPGFASGERFFAPLNWPRTSQPSVEVIVHVSRVRAAFLCFREEAGGSAAGGVTVLVSVGCAGNGLTATVLPTVVLMIVIGASAAWGVLGRG